MTRWRVRYGFASCSLQCPSEQLKQCFKFEENLVEEIGLKPARQSWGLEENTVVNRKIDELGNLYLKVLESEMQAAAKQSTI